jgi:carboxyl-terminal processing protease
MAHEYVKPLLYVVEQVSTMYVRRVPRQDLLEAALKGLYDEVRAPVPKGLREELKQALKKNTLADFLVQVREGLGDAEALRGEKALLASGRAMMRVLDPHSVVVTREEMTRAEDREMEHGVGLEVMPSLGVGPVVVKAVLPGGPAQRAGLRPGDGITHIDGKPVKELTTAQVRVLLHGGAVIDQLRELPPLPPPNVDPGTPTSSAPAGLRLTVVPEGATRPRQVTLPRVEFQEETVFGVARQRDNGWDYWLDRQERIAHVRLGRIRPGTYREMEQVLTALDSGPGLRGLILDLRWCPGGYLNPATETAGLFLDEGLIATVQESTEKSELRVNRGAAKFVRFPTIVLVGGETSGGGELIAAALKDNNRAAVAGQRTRGKASVQNSLPFPVGGAEMRLTTGTFLRPSGKNLHRFADSTPSDDWGVLPDAGLELRASPDLQRQLREWYQEQTLRPGSSSKALPLDDPDADPVRAAALRALRKMIGEKREDPR